MAAMSQFRLEINEGLEGNEGRRAGAGMTRRPFHARKLAHGGQRSDPFTSRACDDLSGLVVRTGGRLESAAPAIAQRVQDRTGSTVGQQRAQQVAHARQLAHVPLERQRARPAPAAPAAATEESDDPYEEPNADMTNAAYVKAHRKKLARAEALVKLDPRNKAFTAHAEKVRVRLRLIEASLLKAKRAAEEEVAAAAEDGAAAPDPADAWRAWRPGRPAAMLGGILSEAEVEAVAAGEREKREREREIAEEQAKVDAALAAAARRRPPPRPRGAGGVAPRTRAVPSTVSVLDPTTQALFDAPL